MDNEYNEVRIVDIIDEDEIRRAIKTGVIVETMSRKGIAPTEIFILLPKDDHSVPCMVFGSYVKGFNSRYKVTQNLYANLHTQDKEALVKAFDMAWGG